MTLLIAKGVSKAYATSSAPFYALRKTSISFPSQGLVAIKGKSGSGKSTLLNLLSGMETPTTGQIFFQGNLLSAKKRPLLGYEGAMVFQHYNLIFGLSALDNVALPLRMRGKGKEKAREAMKHLGIAKLAKRKVDVLSGGEKQRVAICRALVTNPKVIFADEPTGALDEASSTIVMETLKQIAKKRLVVLVSHNEELIEKYADRVIELVDGRVVRDSLPQHGRKKATPREKYRKGVGWIFPFLVRNLRKHAFKNTTCLLSGLIGFSSLLLSLGYMEGNMPAMEEKMGESLTYLQASVSLRSTMEIPGSTLTLVKRTRPTEEEVALCLPGLNNYDAVEDYGFFFPETMVFSCHEEVFEPTAFCPIYDITLTEYGQSMVVAAEPLSGDGLNEAVVNQEFLNKFPSLRLGDELNVSSRSVVTVEGKQNEIFVEASLRVKAVVKEFGFLNTPRIYYSYAGLKNVLANLDLYSDSMDRYSVVEWVERCQADSVYGNYGRRIFLHDPREVATLFQAIEANQNGGEMEILSNVYSLRESFSALSLAFSSSLGLFIGIAIIGLTLILGMASFSSLVQGKKENAVLMSLGASRGDILALYCMEAMGLCLLSSAVSLVFIPVLQGFTNFLLEKEFDIPSLVRIPLASYLSIPYGLVLLVLVGAGLLGLLSSFLPLRVFGHVSLTEELRDE